MTSYMRKLALVAGLVVGIVPLIASSAEFTATEGATERLAKTIVWAGSCGALTGWLVPAVTGLHAVGAVGVGTGVGAPLAPVAFGLGATICGSVAAWDYFGPERKGWWEATKRKGKSMATQAMTTTETLSQGIRERASRIWDKATSP